MCYTDPQGLIQRCRGESPFSVVCWSLGVFSQYRWQLLCVAMVAAAAVAVVAGLSLVTVSPPGAAREEEKQDRGERDVVRLVDDLANRNKPPKVVDAPRLGRVPLFPENFDWNEQNRVLLALEKVHRDKSDELWEELLRGIEDWRYSLTIINIVDEPEDICVGTFCARLAHCRLMNVVTRHLPVTWHPKVGKPPRIVESVAFDSVPWMEWRQKRKDKRLYELQIELCEEALAKLRKAQDIPQDQKVAAQKAIEGEVGRLRKNKSPIVGECSDGLDCYTPEMAKKYRKAIEDGENN